VSASSEEKFSKTGKQTNNIQIYNHKKQKELHGELLGAL